MRLAGTPTERLDRPPNAKKIFPPTQVLYDKLYPQVTKHMAGMLTVQHDINVDNSPDHALHAPHRTARTNASALVGTANLVTDHHRADPLAARAHLDDRPPPPRAHDRRDFEGHLLGGSALPGDAPSDAPLSSPPATSVRRLHPGTLTPLASPFPTDDDAVPVAVVAHAAGRRQLPPPASSIQYTDLGISTDVPEQNVREPTAPATPEGRQYLKCLQRDRKSSIFSDFQYPD